MDKHQSKRLPAEAYEEITGEYPSYVPAADTLREFSLKAVVLGAFFGILFGAANAYLGLKAGLTVTTSIPIAVMTVAFFRLTQGIWGKSTILEHNLSQTVGSASSSLASGVIFTIPALFLWGLNPHILKITVLAMLGGILGILAMVPLRRLLIKNEHGRLPYPEGTACAEILVASEAGGALAKKLFLGLGVGAAYKVALSFLHLWPDVFTQRIPGLKKAVFGMETGPALLGVGYILGYRISAIMVSGSFISWMVFIPLIAYFGDFIREPLFPETEKLIGEMTPSEIWTRYIRYLGAGGVAFGGILTIIRSFPTMVRSFGVGVTELRQRMSGTFAERARTDDDVSFPFLLSGVGLVVLVVAFVPYIFGTLETTTMRLVAAVCIAIFAFFFVVVSSRIVGFVGVSSNPTSGMTIVTLIGTSLLFYLMGWHDMTGKITVLTIGTVVCVAASIAGDTSQDLKTGFLLGATPKYQQRGELLGVLSSAFFVAGAVIVLNANYEVGSSELPAPQAVLMKTVIEGILSANIPWTLVVVGGMMALIVELFGVASLPFAVGLYLPLSTLTPIYAGGILRRIIESRHRGDADKLHEVRERGILYSSGLIAGEGLTAVAVSAFAFFANRKPGGIGHEWMGASGPYVSLALFVLLGFLLFRSTKK
ncbi:MAG: oligopeptide transporter, OPT family [Candidatus Krumholzibacteria bacterium]|nr:oligopeptide transporter, OPT family [Candidatus Krumholzibacteria bacterium]